MRTEIFAQDQLHEFASFTDPQNEIISDLASELIMTRNVNDGLVSRLSALQLSQDNIINAFGITGDGPVSKSVIEYVMGLVAENARMREAIEFATAPDMWQEQCDGMLDYRYVDWYVDVLNAALEPKSTDAAIAEIKAQGLDHLASICKSLGDEERDACTDYVGRQCEISAANLRAGRKG